MAVKEIFHLPSSDGHSRLYGVIWKPVGKVRMVLQIAHGMIEHMGYYEGFALRLTEAGIAVAGHDHLGHGRTAEKPEQFGFFAEKEGDRYLVKDLNRVRTYLQKQYENLPYFLMGHSMGSFMVRRYLTVFGEGLSGAILMGTGNQPKAAVLAGLALTSAASGIKGAAYRSEKMQDIWRTFVNSRFRPCRTSMDWLTTDEQQVDRFLADPYCSYLFTNSGYRDLLRMVWDSESRRLAERIPKQLPVLFVSGQDDPVGDFGKGVKRACDLFQEAGLLDVEMRLYPNCRHELVIEKDWQMAADDIRDWMDAQAE